MSLLKDFLIVICIIGGVFAQGAYAADRKIEVDDAYVLLDQALNLSEVGENHALQLRQYKKWSTLHGKLTSGKKLSNSQMKLYLFMIFVAEQKAKTESLEEIAAEILLIYKKQSTDVLQILKETPFMLTTTCGSLNEHFELYGDANGKQKFVEENRAQINAILGEQLTADCLAKFK